MIKDHAHVFINMDEINQFFERQSIKTYQIDHLNSRMKSLMITFQKRKHWVQMGLPNIKKEITPILYSFFRR